MFWGTNKPQVVKIVAFSTTAENTLCWHKGVRLYLTKYIEILGLFWGLEITSNSSCLLNLYLSVSQVLWIISGFVLKFSGVGCKDNAVDIIRKLRGLMNQTLHQNKQLLLRELLLGNLVRLVLLRYILNYNASHEE